MASVVGVAAYFVPFYVFAVGGVYGQVDVSAYRLTVGFGDEALDADLLYEADDTLVYSADPDREPESGKKRSSVPLYFLGVALVLVAALAANVRRHLGRVASLYGLVGGSVAVGGWVREQNMVFVDDSSRYGPGATLLVTCGVASILISLAALLFGQDAGAGRIPAARTLTK